ncbi:MAG: DUF6798 domain-containing protein [Verrucomicrobiota bacterium]
MTNTSNCTPVPPDRRYRLLWLLACLALAWLQMTLAGYELGVGNQAIQVPFLLRLHDATLFTRDVMVGITLDAYPSLFYRGLAHALSLVSLPTLYYGLHFLTTAGVFFFVIELCRAMFGSYWPGLVACLFLLAGHHRALAEQTLYSTCFTHTWAVFPLTLAALAMLYRDRPFAAFTIAGVCFNIHALEAGQLAIALTTWAVFSVPPRKVAALLLVFIVLATPTLFQMLQHREHFGADWFQLMHIRSGHHSFPFQWWRAGQADVPRFLLILALAGVAMSLVPGPHVRKTLLLTAGIALMFVAGILFSEVWPNALVIRAQLFRSSRFLMIIALAYIAAGCVRARGWELIGAALVVACLAAPPWLILLPVTLLVTTLLALSHRRLLWQQATLVGSALLVTLAAWRTIDFVPVGFAWNFHRPESSNDPGWIDAQLWAREHTARDALFLTPAQMSGFRIYSQRAVVGEWRDGTQLYFSARFAGPWWERMEALQPGMRIAPDGRRLLVQGRSLSQLDDEQILVLAKRSAVDYVVLASDPPRKLVTAYRNPQWTIYRPEVDTSLLVAKPGFFEDVVLPNLEKHRKGDVRLQLVDVTGRPLVDAPYRIWATNELTVTTNCLAGFTPGRLRATPEDSVEKELTEHAFDLIGRNTNRVDFWELTDPGLSQSQMSNLVAAIRGKFPTIKLGLSVAPLLTAPDSPRGLADVRQLKGLDFVAIRAVRPVGVWADPKTLYDIFDAFAKEGLRIRVTEFVAPTNGWIEGSTRQGQWTPELAAEYHRQFRTVALSHPAVDAVNGSESWETNGVVALNGVIRFRGLTGHYVVAVGTAPASFPVTRGTNSNYRFQLDAAGKTLTVIK